MGKSQEDGGSLYTPLRSFRFMQRIFEGLALGMNWKRLTDGRKIEEESDREGHAET